MTEGNAPASLSVVTAMRQRRMHRVFEDRPVPVDLLKQMEWAARRAQQARSGVRTIVVVDDPRLMAVARQSFPGFVNNAPAMFVLCTDTTRARQVLGQRGVDHNTRLDAGAACAHLALMGQVLGLGVCTVTSWSDAAVSALLNLPAHVRPDVTVAVGFASSTSASKAAKAFQTTAYHNTYGEHYETGSADDR